MSSVAPIVEQAHRLYDLTPEEFTAARNALARDAKGSDAELSKQIAGLRKPTPAAWLANALLRERRDEVEEALELGAELREAQDELDRDELTKLVRQRRALVAALAKQGTELARELGHPVSATVVEELSQTLQAAMTDASAADAFRSGRLVRALATVGFEPVDLEDAVAMPGGVVRAFTPRPKADPKAAAALAAEKAAAEKAARALAAAEATLADIDKQIVATDRRRDELELDLARAEARVRDLKADIAAVDRTGRALDRDKAQRAVDSGTAAIS